MLHVKTFYVLPKTALGIFREVVEIHFYNKQYQIAMMENILEASDPEDGLQPSEMEFLPLSLAFFSPLHLTTSPHQKLMKRLLRFSYCISLSQLIEAPATEE